MAPSRKKRKASSAPKEPDDPLEFVANIRENGQKRFVTRRKNITYDIDQNVREIRALLNINAEIFGRVIDSASNYSSGESMTLTRYEFDTVKVHQHGVLTEFFTEATSSTNVFGIKDMLFLPAGLEDVLVVRYQAAPLNNFIDYNDFFRSALMLHDDILMPFLVKLKDRVESIHVLLGEMESWLLESQRKIDFIQSTFDKKLEMPTPDSLYSEEVSECNPLCRHSSLERCQRCRNYFQNHTFDSNSRIYRCSGYPVNTAVNYSFLCKKEIPKKHVLKSYRDSGKFEKTFNITTDSDQAKLKKFLEYMES